MKRILLAVCALAILLCGCVQQPTSSEPTASSPPKTTTTTTAHIGEEECTEHYLEYHNIDGRLFDHFGDDINDVIKAFDEKYNGEDFTIIAFVKDHNIDKETFMRLMGITEENRGEPLEGTAIAGTIIAGEYVDAIYSNDPAKIDAVFKRKEVPTSSDEPTVSTTTISAPTRTTTTKPK